LAGDYEEVTKELRVSDERYQRVQNELKHTVEIVHEEQERIVKIEAIKKSLEIEVKNLSVRLEEVEANAIVGGKRIISKLEARVREYERFSHLSIINFHSFLAIRVATLLISQ
jgi:RNase P/RNase MRP subunit p29